MGGGAEEATTVVSGGGGSSSLSSYYTFGGLPTIMRGTDGSLSTLGSDGLGSTSAALSGSNGTLVAQQLYGPYGTVRYSSGQMPTAKGFTGQYADAATGLDYYVARYYDPLAGQFTTPDSMLPGDGLDPWGLSRYAYVAGNPETRTDPSGHCWPLCAVLAAVAVTVAVTLAQATIQYVSTGQVDWGSDLKTGATAGLVVGATMLAGPAVELAGGAIAGVVSGGATALGASAAAGEVAGSVIAGGIMGAGEGLVQGAIAGDRGGDLLADAGIGALSGGVGGVFGSFAGRFGRMGRILGREEAGARLTGLVGNGSANAVSQGFQMVRGRQDGFDPMSFGISLGIGWGWGSAVTSDRPTFRSFQRHPFLTAASFAGADAFGQISYAFVTGRIDENYSSGDVVVHHRHGW